MVVLPSSYDRKNVDTGSLSGQKRALFLDRDGVININYGYVYLTKNFEFIDGIFDVARTAHVLGYKLIVITNQSGIGRGYYSEHQFQELTAWMCDKFLNEGAPIQKVYFSPFHPTAGLGKYKKNHISRKPGPGMIYQAQRDINLDLGGSILIGDEVSDIQAGISAGVGFNILFSQKRISKVSGLTYKKINKLREAIFFIKGCNQKLT